LRLRFEKVIGKSLVASFFWTRCINALKSTTELSTKPTQFERTDMVVFRRTHLHMHKNGSVVWEKAQAD